MSLKNPADIQSLVSQLANTEPVTRERARETLVKNKSHAVTQALVVELTDPRKQVRWEAAKALISIADPIAAPGLVFHLDDEEEDIRWLAAEGLAVLGEAGLLATLSGAIRLAQSSQFCRAAHHAFKDFQKRGIHSDQLDHVIKACVAPEPAVSLPVASYEALQVIRNGAPPSKG